MTLPFVQLLESPVMPVTGGVLSMLTGELVALAALPALSDTEADTVTLLPAVEMVLSPGTVAGSTPDRSSVAVQWMVTLPLYQPFVFGEVVGVPVRVGVTRSMLMPLT